MAQTRPSHDSSYLLAQLLVVNNARFLYSFVAQMRQSIGTNFMDAEICMDHATSELENAITRAHASPHHPVNPDEFLGLPLDDAYDVQRAVSLVSKLPVVVWKLGLTGAGARAAFGSDEPVVGRLPGSAIYSDRSKIAYVGPEMYAEAEIIFEFGADLPTLDRPYTREDIAQALMGVYLGIEIVRTRFSSSDLELPQLVADNVMAHGLLLGRKLASEWDESFGDIGVTLQREGHEPVPGSTSNVMGNPIDAVVWLANWLQANEGRSITREQLVASGSCTVPAPIFAGDIITAYVDDTPSARISIDI